MGIRRPPRIVRCDTFGAISGTGPIVFSRQRNHFTRVRTRSNHGAELAAFDPAGPNFLPSSRALSRFEMSFAGHQRCDFSIPLVRGQKRLVSRENRLSGREGISRRRPDRTVDNGLLERPEKTTKIFVDIYEWIRIISSNQ